jgi:tetratricopeptide (TPR) repeat protein
MRLLERGDSDIIKLREFSNDKVPPYAILSHTWGDEEVTFKDLTDGTGRKKLAYHKIVFCVNQAWQDGFRYSWVDTCCIDKSSSAELQTSINYMFRWYYGAARCYVYLSDVSTKSIRASNQSTDNQSTVASWEPAFRNSKWFTRGWTLQELIAPVSVTFYSRDGHELGTKASLEQVIHDITKIPIKALRQYHQSDYSVSERIAWMTGRETTLPEDKAYSLFGLFNIQIPLLYGEGEEEAFLRLREKLNRASKNDHTKVFRQSHHGVEEPQKHWVVPLGRNKDFVGRESVLESVLEKISPQRNKDDCQRTAIEGLGGIGKTQIALEAAFRIYEEHNCNVFWVPAVDSTTFENAYLKIGRQLEVEGINDDKADIKLLVKTALSQSADNWLLIIDNADDIELLFSGTAPLSNYLPFNSKGSILFTTRNYAVAVKLGVPPRDILSTAEMSLAEATELLRRSLREGQIGDADNTSELLSFLTYLPLAIRQASAYMAETGMSITKYLRHCHSSDRTFIKLLSRDFVDLGRYESVENPVATTWLISFNHISQYPLAAQYLKFMCFLAEKEIPISLLPPADELDADEALGMLKAYAFITEHTDHNLYDIHRLVRLVMHNWLEEKGELKLCLTSIFQRLREVFPFPEHENRVVWGSYLPHVLKALEFRDNLSDDEVKHRLLFNVAESKFILGKYGEAEAMHWQALSLATKTLSAEHPSTLISLNNLASLLHRQGKFKEAEAMHRQTLEGYIKTLGADHPSTLTSMNNLAIVLDRQGKYEEAETMHRQTLEGYINTLGADNPSTLTSMNNLAIVLDRQGKYKEAEAIHRQTLEGYIRTLNIEHPSTLTSMNNLAIVLDRQGKYEEAETMHRQTLEGYIKTLSAEHPSTLTSMNNLALVLYNQGKYKEAEVIQQQTLSLKMKSLGANHPSTLTSMNNLASVLDSQGKYKEAEVIHRQTLSLTMKSLGAEHPSTISSMNNLANVLDSRGRHEEGEAMHRQALESRAKTLTSMNNLASVLGNQGK